MPEPTPETGIRPEEWSANNKQAISDALNLEEFKSSIVTASSDSTTYNFTLGVPISAKVGGTEAEGWTFDPGTQVISDFPHSNGDTLEFRYKEEY